MHFSGPAWKIFWEQIICEFNGEDFEAGEDFKDGKDLDNKDRIREPWPFHNFFETLLAKRIRSSLERKKVHNYDQKDYKTDSNAVISVVWC